MRLFDAHFHLIDPRFPLVPNDGYLPPPFTVADYRARMRGADLAGGAVVSGSFQAFDQTYLVAALAELGPGFVGVTQLPAAASDEEILSLDNAGVRAVRFNVRRGGSESLAALESFATRVHELARWHVELYIDSRALPEVEATLARLPAVSIDHLGLSRAGFPALLRLAEGGVRVKATGFSRGDLDVPRALREIAAANPDALMFGTDLPSTRAPRAYEDADLRLLCDALEPALAEKALLGNALAFYRVRAAAGIATRIQEGAT
ncbi:MAG TPA: amidohydrolase family protein [Pelomicrobium sp.]|nr:amidohydrolase family protein [Pelomicrobium sp.]